MFLRLAPAPPSACSANVGPGPWASQGRHRDCCDRCRVAPSGASGFMVKPEAIEFFFSVEMGNQWQVAEEIDIWCRW